MEKLAYEKLIKGTDLDCKIIGLNKREHAKIYQRLLAFIYSGASKDYVSNDLSNLKSKITSTWILDRIDEENLNLGGYDFNGLPDTKLDNFYVSRKHV
jgi:hypothetical protein